MNRIDVLKREDYSLVRKIDIDEGDILKSMIVVNDTFLFCGGTKGIINKFEVGNFKKLYEAHCKT